MSDLAQHLERFPRTEIPMALVCLVDDLLALKIASLWELANAEWTTPGGRAPTDLRELWEWVWSGVECDWEAFAQMVGATDKVLAQRMALLTGARLIFPDGTIHPALANMVKRRVYKELKTR